jgi:DNA invertase Pin-like site-specific DNA recombinase
MQAMIASATAGAFDVLLAGYSDRWERNLRRTLELLEDDLHPAGVALVMCDRRILSSDPHDWDELVAEAAAAERCSRRLGERITDGYSAKFRYQNDQGGLPPPGFRRTSEPPRILEVDPNTIGQTTALFQRYALGTVSTRSTSASSWPARRSSRRISPRRPMPTDWQP